MNLLLLFTILTIANVILSTARSIITVNGSKWIAALVSAISYGFYTIVIVYSVCDLPLLYKALITAGCNLIGVLIVKFIEEKARKERLWKIEFTIKDCPEQVDANLTRNNIPHNYIVVGKHTIFNCYCSTKEESTLVEKTIRLYSGKYFISESKVF